MDHRCINTNPDQLLTFTQLPYVTIRNTSKVSPDLGPRYAIENQIYCKDLVSPRSKEGHQSVTGFWKSLATQQEKSQVQAPRMSAKDTHTCDCGSLGGTDDWQKVSGTTRQPHTDTQQADVTDCMIRGRTGSHGKEGSSIFRESWHLSHIIYGLILNSAATPFVLRLWLNNYLLTYWPILKAFFFSFCYHYFSK